MQSTRETLEEALISNPDDLALHAAYADCLIEAGDTRGDYIRMQLLLENTDQPNSFLRRQAQQSYELRLAHEHEWLGPLAKYLPSSQRTTGLSIEELNDASWKCGWIDELVILQSSPEFRQALQEASILKLLSTLSLQGILGSDGESLQTEADFEGWYAFCCSRQWRSLRRLILSDLRLGYAGLMLLLRSPMLDRVESLSLTYCGLTDDAAVLLAEDPRIRGMKDVQLNMNYLTPIGLQTLEAIGIIAGEQFGNPAWSNEIPF